MSGTPGGEVLRVAIIGGGSAGLTAAWLLDQDHEVTLYEKEPRLGGHAWTIPVDLGGAVAHVDAGSEFFSDGMFPTFARLLRLLDVPLTPYHCTATFHATDGDHVRHLPPRREGRIVWSGFAPGHLADLIQFAYVLRAARGLMRRRDTSITLGGFVEGLPGLRPRFKERFLYPFLLAQWCVEPDEFRRFIAYDALRYCYMHFGLSLDAPKMLHIDGGTQSYVERLRGQLRRATLRTGAEVRGIERSPEGLTVVTAEGARARHDAVILATNAQAASRLARGVAGADEASRQLGRVEYFRTAIAIHGDARLLPRRRDHWSVVNTRWDGTHAQNTVWKPWLSPPERPIFKSWVTYERELPEPLHALVEFDHPKIDARYFEAQQALTTLQGRSGLWFAGMQTWDVDCHESAVVSAAHVVRQLSPNSRRLQQLLGG